jgi:hypothetical protein
MMRFKGMTDEELRAEVQRLRAAATDAPRDSQSDARARWSFEYGAALEELARRLVR